MTGSRVLLATAVGAGLLVCAGCEQDPRLTAEMPLRLADHLDAATVSAPPLPSETIQGIQWLFDEPQPDWNAVAYPRGPVRETDLEEIADGIRLRVTEEQRANATTLLGLVSVDLPDYRFGDWGRVLVRARSSDVVGTLHVGFNLQELPTGGTTGLAATAWSASGEARLIGDGLVHTYAFAVDRLDMGERGVRVPARAIEDPLRQMALRLFAETPSSLDVLSVTLEPVAAAYTGSVGVRMESFEDGTHRRALYVRAPARIDFPVTVPVAGQLDVGLLSPTPDSAQTFRIEVRPERGDPETLLAESLPDAPAIHPRSLDLSHLAGQDVMLSLEADAQQEGAIALWVEPTLSGARSTERPNVILYVIDGGSSDHMSIYGYPRRTTPNLELLAAEGAVFSNAYSNATHTEASTPSFVTSLHTSVILGPPEGDPVVPDQGVSLAERLRAIGYQTALLTDNPNAGRWAGVERGADMFGDAFPLDVPGIASSAALQGHFWRWREAYPGEPYLIHFQTTDVHRPWASVPPFAGLFLPGELRRRATERADRLSALGGHTPLLDHYEQLGLDVDEHLSDVAALYDETMAEQDFMLGQLVNRLRAEGEWDNTLLIVAADHGHWAGGLMDPRQNPYDPMFRRAVTRIPLLFVWPGRIPGGHRFEEPVSMIDLLPTILDLIDVAPPEITQGQSLAPLFLGEEGWEPRPVILDEFVLDRETEEPTGVIEVIDGRWGASLLVNADQDARIGSRRDTPLLLYDLLEDPFTQRSLHEERPDLAQYYVGFLEEQLEAHLSLAEFFTGSSAARALTPEQLERLRTLGYIR